MTNSNDLDRHLDTIASALGFHSRITMLLVNGKREMAINALRDRMIDFIQEALEDPLLTGLAAKAARSIPMNSLPGLYLHGRVTAAATRLCEERDAAAGAKVVPLQRPASD